MNRKEHPIQLVIDTRPRPVRYNLIGAVKITSEAEIALRKLNQKTGMSMRQIASSLIEQAAECVEIIYQDEMEDDR